MNKRKIVEAAIAGLRAPRPVEYVAEGLTNPVVPGPRGLAVPLYRRPNPAAAQLQRMTPTLLDMFTAYCEVDDASHSAGAYMSAIAELAIAYTGTQPDPEEAA